MSEKRKSIFTNKSSAGKGDSPRVGISYEECEKKYEKIFNKKNAFKEIRQLLADNKITDFADLFRLLYDEVDSWGKGHVAECILIVARYELSDSQVVDKEINVMAMLIELLGVIK